MTGVARTVSLALGLALVLAPGKVVAQDAAGVRAAVDRLFEGMRQADPESMRSVLAEEARFAVLDAQGNSAPLIGAQDTEGWLQAIGTSGRRWNEQIYEVVVNVDGPMASVWAPYTFYLDGQLSHCGVNSIELLRDAQGWKITQVSDTRRTADCPDPLGR